MVIPESFWKLCALLLLWYGWVGCPHAQRSIMLANVRPTSSKISSIESKDNIKASSPQKLGYKDFPDSLQKNITSSSKYLINAANQIRLKVLWGPAAFAGWRPSSAPRSEWPPPTKESNGYLLVRCTSSQNQQWSASKQRRCANFNAVFDAQIVNTTLVLPELDANSFWHDDRGFNGIYDIII